MQMKSVMEMFEGGDLEYKVMGKCGCLSYVSTAWELVKPDVFERRICYKFNRQFSIFGGEVTCTQQKIPLPNGKGWSVNEVMALDDIPFSDHFRVSTLFAKLSGVKSPFDIAVIAYRFHSSDAGTF